MSNINVEVVERRLKELFEKEKDGFVALIVGEWGSGKTEFWKNFVKNYLLTEQKPSPENKSCFTKSLGDFKCWWNDFAQNNLNPDKKILESTESCYKEIKNKTLIGWKWVLDKTTSSEKSTNEGTPKNNIVYISLYGQNSIQDIKTEILLQVSPNNKTINKLDAIVKYFKTSVGDVSLSGNAIGALLSTLTNKNYKDVIICFDDFERISANLDLKEVLGLISYLKEEKNCRIVMIMNENELQKTDELNSRKIIGVVDKKCDEENENVCLRLGVQNYHEIFKYYGDKTVDYDFPFRPTPGYNFEFVKERLNRFDMDVLSKLFESQNITNIRVMKRVINDLNDFSFIIEESSEIDKNILDGIITEIFYKVVPEKFLKYPRVSEQVIAFGSLPDNVKNYIYEYYEYRTFNKQDFIAEIQSAITEKTKYSMRDKIREEYFNHTFDFKYDDKTYYRTIQKILQDFDRKEAVNILGLNDFNFYIDTLKKSTDDNFKNQIEKYYRDAIMEYIDGIDFNKNDYIREFDGFNTIKDNPDFYEYYQKKEAEFFNKHQKSEEEIIELMNTPRKRSGWGRKEEKGLSSIPEVQFVKLISESRKFSEEAFRFVQFCNGITGERPFDEVCKKIINAFEKIGEKDKRALELAKKLKKEE